MNKTTIFHKFRAVCLILTVIISTMLLTGCEKEPLVIEDSEKCIVIRTDKDFDDSTETTLMDYMETLKADGTLDYTVKDGMITAVNGIENASDFSECWMLYTSDADNANSAWGTVKYEDVEYGSAVLGADALVIKPECLYIWVFQSTASE